LKESGGWAEFVKSRDSPSDKTGINRHLGITLSGTIEIPRAERCAPARVPGTSAMPIRRLPLLGLLALSGCATHQIAEQTDRMVAEIAARPVDPDPQSTSKPATTSKKSEMPSGGTLSESNEKQSLAKDVQTATYLAQVAEKKDAAFKLEVPADIPGQEVPLLQRVKDEKLRLEMLRRLYPPLPALPEVPKAVPGPDGKPYTLRELQEIAALNSPTLKQAVADVRAAQGALMQTRTYANPTLAYSYQASNDGETAGVHGLLFDQKINTAGKMSLRVAAAQKDYENAQTALKRARSDLATAVRNAYFGLLVARETVIVNRAISALTDEVYRANADLLLKGPIAAGHEPSSLRAQAYTARLALKQSITNYQFAWTQVVTTIGLRHLPLSEVAGRVDSFIPYYEYEAVNARVLTSHTDILTARNSIEKARYNLKLARVTPFSDIDFQVYVGKETALAPFQWQAVGQVGITLPLWDQNRGNIISAESALIRAVEQPHASEITLTNNLQNAYNLYKNNLDALDFYRRYILPDQIRYYRGVLERRQLDPGAQFGDLVQAQQTLASNVTTYLSILGQLWTSAVQVADFLQIDDLFELAKPEAIPPLPDLGQLPPLPCCHPDNNAPIMVPSHPANRVECESPLPELLPPAAPTPNSNSGGAPLLAPQGSKP
jgi:cobalt-zinc-cadmium efflux system outer membrane protein